MRTNKIKIPLLAIVMICYSCFLSFNCGGTKQATDTTTINPIPEDKKEGEGNTDTASPQDSIPDKTPVVEPQPKPPSSAPKATPIKISIGINNSFTDKDDYITWSPIPCKIQIENGNQIENDVEVRLSNKKTSGGQIIFSESMENFSQSEILKLILKKDGSPTFFFIAGKFGHPSFEDKDAIIQIKHLPIDSTLLEHGLMIRIRKNANNLTNGERKRFLDALTKLHINNGNYKVYIDLHQDNTKNIGHTGPGFLPWHRALLMDLERELQIIDPSVTMPYWKFDDLTNTIFNKDFMGEQPLPNEETVQFDPSNPLSHWSIDGVDGIERNDSTFIKNHQFIAPEEISIGKDNYLNFRQLEANPHGNAHILFSGYLNLIGTAVKDPMFFLLHCNADRIWAKWQWQQEKYDASDESCFAPQGKYKHNTQFRIGHFVEDSMWPWNGKTGTGAIFDFGSYPTTALGGPMPEIPGYEKRPGPTPDVKDMIDYRGTLSPDNYMNFDYDDIPFFNQTNN